MNSLRAGAVRSRPRADGRGFQARRLGRGVRVEGGFAHRPADAAGPEPVTDDLVRVRLPRDRVGARPLRRPPARESGHGQVEASPEEVDGAALSDEAAPERLEHGLHGDERPPERVRRRRVVGSMHRVRLEADRIRNLHRLRPDADVDPQPAQGIHHEPIELGDRPRLEPDPLRAAVGAAEDELVGDEVERDRDGPIPVGQRRRREAPRSHLEGDVPVVVRERRERETDLAHDLRPHVERGEGVLPRLERQGRPRLTGRNRYGYALLSDHAPGSRARRERVLHGEKPPLRSARTSREAPGAARPASRPPSDRSRAPRPASRSRPSRAARPLACGRYG